MQNRLIAIASLLIITLSGCGIFKGDKCDCPKFSHNQTIQAPMALELPDNLLHGGISHHPTLPVAVASH